VYFSRRSATDKVCGLIQYRVARERLATSRPADPELGRSLPVGKMALQRRLTTEPPRKRLRKGTDAERRFPVISNLFPDTPSNDR
jgi:hypothetical protein